MWVMGRAARANPRSREGGTPAAYASLHRLWRAVAFFGNDRSAFDRWLDDKAISSRQRQRLERLWQEQHPQPRVIIAHA